MFTHNKHNHSLLDYEEALILHQLKQIYQLTHKDISLLVGYGISWVSRRLSLVERLETSVKESLQMGLLSITQARDIVKLPRGNQQEMVKCIINNGLTSRQSSGLIHKLLETKDRDKQKHLLENPKQVLQTGGLSSEPAFDSRLDKQANQLLRTINASCLQMSLLNDMLVTQKISALTPAAWSIIEPLLSKTAYKSEELAQLIHLTKNNKK